MDASQSSEDAELRELVTSALEKNGVLAAVRAHLRAGVFLALEREHHGSHQRTGLVQRLLDEHHGLLAVLLVQDFLDSCQLRHTASVFRAETGHGRAPTRDSIVRDYSLGSALDGQNLPLLVQLLTVVLTVLEGSKNERDHDDYDNTFTSSRSDHKQNGHISPDESNAASHSDAPYTSQYSNEKTPTVQDDSVKETSDLKSFNSTRSDNVELSEKSPDSVLTKSADFPDESIQESPSIKSLVSQLVNSLKASSSRSSVVSEFEKTANNFPGRTIELADLSISDVSSFGDAENHNVNASNGVD